MGGKGRGRGGGKEVCSMHDSRMYGYIWVMIYGNQMDGERRKEAFTANGNELIDLDD